jgi:hypothetical protein
MMAGNGERVNVSRLRKLYSTSTAGRAALEYFAQRQKNSRVTTVDRLQGALEQGGHDVARSDIVEFFRGLDEAGCGSFVVGRKGKLSRFEWDVGLTEVGRSAKGESVEPEPIGSVEADDEAEEETDGGDGLREHRFWLRADLEIRMHLPRDLASAEASRLSEFIRTLPLT